MKKILTAGYFLICLAYPALSQHYITQIQTYGIEDGLTDHCVYAIMEDKAGFVWIGSPIGLLLFDGYTFKPFTKSNSGLTNSRVNGIFQDPEGMLWLFSEKQNMLSEIDIFNPASGKATSFSQVFSPKLPFPVPVFTGMYAEASDGTLYLGTRDSRGMLCYHPTSGFKWLKITENQAFQPIFCTGHQTIWGYTYADDKKPETAAKKLIEIDFKGHLLRDLGAVVPKIQSSKRFVMDGNFFYEKKNAENLVQTWRYHHKAVPADKNPVFSIKRNPLHIAPLATYLWKQQLYACDTKIIDIQTNKTILDLTRSMPEINNFGINAWHVDRGGKLWIGTDFGLAIIDVQPSKFNTWLFNGDNTKMGISIRGILLLDDKTAIVNTEGFGQWRINNSTGRASLTAEGPKYFSYGIGRDDAGSLYYSASANDLVQLSANGKSRHFKGTVENAACFFNDAKQKRLWIGTRGHGLSVFNLESNQIQPFTQYNGFDELNNANIFFIEKDKAGMLWISADIGFFQLDPGKGIVARYWSGGKGKYYMPHDFFVHSYLDREDVFWLVTYGGGIIRWDKKSGKFQHFGLESGFLTEYNYAVYEDAHKHLWIPGIYGITQFDKVNGEVRKIYSTYDGLTNQEFNAYAHAQSRDGTLYFGGLNGLVSFHPDDFYDTTNLSRVPLVLTNCRQYDAALGKSTDITNEVLKNNAIILSPGNRFFTIDLALLTYEELAEVRYAYRFDNEKKWIYHNGRTLEFGDLSYGQHTLYLSAITAKGTMSANELNLTIHQLRPLYLQIWFILLMVLLIFSAFAAYLRWQTYQLKANQRVLEDRIKEATSHIQQQAAQLVHLDEVKSRFFANISHELRTPLTLILGPINTIMKSQGIEKKEYTLLKMAQQQGKSLLKLVNQLLDLTKLESGKLEIHETVVPFQAFMNRIFASFESQAVQKRLQFDLHYHAEKDLYLWLDAPKLETILYNLISNAIKFTPSGENIQLVATDAGKTIQIKVSDSGRGIHPDDLQKIFERFYQSSQPDTPVEGGTGIGLALCKDLSHLLSGRIRVESPNPDYRDKGSVFYLEIPKKIAEPLQQSEIMALDRNEAEPESQYQTDENQPTSRGNIAPPVAHRQRILVVEDNTDLLEYLKLILSERFHIEAVENGQLALDFLNSAAPDVFPHLILSDIMMPEMDGFQLLEKLKAHNRFMLIPVVLLTARADILDKLKALRIGVDDYLLKPFEEEELIARIDNLLKNYTIRMEMRAILEEKKEDSKPENDTGVFHQPVSVAEQQWLDTLESIVKSNLGNSLFSSDFLAAQIGLSHRQVQRKVIAMTGLTLHEYIAEIRMSEARRLLESGSAISIKALAHSLGFSSRKYFSTLFKVRFGKMPSEYLTNSKEYEMEP